MDNNFISSLYIKTNAVSNEMICAGLVAVTANKLHFAFSNEKLKIVKKLISDEVYHSVRKSLKRFEKDIESINKKSKQFNLLENNRYTHDYFNYLHNYSKGIIAFDAPHTLSKNISDNEFTKLLNKYVGEEADKRSDIKKPESFI